MEVIEDGSRSPAQLGGAALRSASFPPLSFSLFFFFLSCCWTTSCTCQVGPSWLGTRRETPSSLSLSFFSSLSFFFLLGETSRHRGSLSPTTARRASVLTSSPSLIFFPFFLGGEEAERRDGVYQVVFIAAWPSPLSPSLPLVEEAVLVRRTGDAESARRFPPRAPTSSSPPLFFFFFFFSPICTTSLLGNNATSRFGLPPGGCSLSVRSFFFPPFLLLFFFPSAAPTRARRRSVVTPDVDFPFFSFPSSFLFLLCEHRRGSGRTCGPRGRNLAGWRGTFFLVRKTSCYVGLARVQRPVVSPPPFFSPFLPFFPPLFFFFS